MLGETDEKTSAVDGAVGFNESKDAAESVKDEVNEACRAEGAERANNDCLSMFFTPFFFAIENDSRAMEIFALVVNARLRECERDDRRKRREKGNKERENALRKKLRDYDREAKQENIG